MEREREVAVLIPSENDGTAFALRYIESDVSAPPYAISMPPLDALFCCLVLVPFATRSRVHC
jgi:hypothetical protein